MLRRIVAAKRHEVDANKISNPRRLLEKELSAGKFAFGNALTKRNWSLIAECKLVSPAKGKLCATHSITELAKLYEAGGAAALSVHTDSHFAGQLGDIGRVRAVSRLPILRKDFIIDEYQLYEARWAGADAVLLIAAVLTDKELKNFLHIAGQLGMNSLAEVHDKEELQRVQRAGAGIIGINNRNLVTFATDIQNTFDLLPYGDRGRIFISESGISEPGEAKRLKAAGVRGALVGEGLVKAADIALLTKQLSCLDEGE